MSARPDHLIFLHIPKTAGTTLIDLLRRQYPDPERFELGPVAQESIAAFKALTQLERDRTKLLSGHMGFGLHHQFSGQTEYFTMLRDPVERVLSYWFYILRQPTHCWYDTIQTEKLTLDTLLDKPWVLTMDNLQVRLLSGVFLDAPYGGVTNAMLETAKQNLRNHFAVVGLMEAFDASLILLQRQFGWRSIHYTRRNVTQGRPSRDTVSPELLTKIERINAQDLALYAYGRSLFERQVADQGASFGLRLALLPYSNRLANLYWQFLNSPLGVRLRSAPAA